MANRIINLVLGCVFAAIVLTMAILCLCLPVFIHHSTGKGDPVIQYGLMKKCEGRGDFEECESYDFDNLTENGAWIKTHEVRRARREEAAEGPRTVEEVILDWNNVELCKDLYISACVTVSIALLLFASEFFIHLGRPQIAIDALLVLDSLATLALMVAAAVIVADKVTPKGYAIGAPVVLGFVGATFALSMTFTTINVLVVNLGREPTISRGAPERQPPAATGHSTPKEDSALLATQKPMQAAPPQQQMPPPAPAPSAPPQPPAAAEPAPPEAGPPAGGPPPPPAAPDAAQDVFSSSSMMNDDDAVEAELAELRGLQQPQPDMTGDTQSPKSTPSIINHRKDHLPNDRHTKVISP